MEVFEAEGHMKWSPQSSRVQALPPPLPHTLKKSIEVDVTSQQKQLLMSEKQDFVHIVMSHIKNLINETSRDHSCSWW